MRIIAGSLKGRRLKSVRGTAIRPTADRVREGLFNMLVSRFELQDCLVLDIFAGTGALGIEALSRGARRAVFVEHNRTALRVLRANIEDCGLESRAEVWPLPVRHALREFAQRGYRFDGVLLDPPYGQGLIGPTMLMLSELGLLEPGAWVAAEGHIQEPPADSLGCLRLTRTRRYGKTSIRLYSQAHFINSTTGT